MDAESETRSIRICGWLAHMKRVGNDVVIILSLGEDEIAERVAEEIAEKCDSMKVARWLDFGEEAKEGEQ